MPYTWIYVGAQDPIPFVVDYEDYHWAIQWLWDKGYSKRSATRREKIYARRRTKTGGRNSRQIWVHLHREIMRRVRKQPSRRHVCDHINGNTFDTRRCNLRWATKKANRRNIRG